MSVTAKRIVNVREALGLTRAQFAEVMGVHPATSYRWEAARGTVRVDPFHDKLLSLLVSLRSATLNIIGGRVKYALTHGECPEEGELHALYLLLAGALMARKRSVR